MKILITGAAGFIGFHIAQALLAQGAQVIGIDNLNDYYDVNLKQARLAYLTPHKNFVFCQDDIADTEAMETVVKNYPDITHVIHLAAQAGVRYSLVNPYAYIHTNVMGHTVMLEAARRLPNLRHFVYASSSSVYGNNTKLPFVETDNVDQPASLYAATKKTAELTAHTYSHLYNIPTTGLRFFTVYGPWGRPDMAAYIFTKKIFDGEPIDVFNHGAMQRDFTYIDDIVTGVLGAMQTVPNGAVPYAIYNLGNHRSEKLLDFIGALEAATGRAALMNFAPLQPGDVPATYADITAATQAFGFAPATSIAVGIPRFVDWYKTYHQLT